MFKLFFFLLFSISIVSVKAQGFGKFIKKALPDSALGTSAARVFGSASVSQNLSTETIANGLKEALEVGTQRGMAKLSSENGFFKDAAVKILMPAEAQKVEQRLRGMGLGSQVDQAILSMNRAAEDAAKNATPIMIAAVKQLTIADAVDILKGGDFAATNYLKNKTSVELTNAFKPVIELSLAKVGATKYWNTIFSTYNQFSLNKVNTDLSAYVTDKALAGIFHELSLEEQKIRKDPAKQTTELLKKVFGKN